MTGPASDTGTPGAIDPGETWTYTATYQVTQADINAGASLVNTVSVTTAQVTAPQDAVVTTITQNPAMTVSKDVAQAAISAAGQLDYTITVTNTGNMTLNSPVLNDTFPTGGVVCPVTLVPASDSNGNNLLDVGEAWQYATCYTVSAAEITAGVDRVNSVTVDATTTAGGPAVASQTDDAVTVVDAVYDFTIDKSVDQSSINAPTTLNYVISVANAGNQPLTAVTVVDTLPGGSGTVTPTSPTSGDGNANGVLDVGEVWQYAVPFAVSQAQIDAGAVLTNSVSVTATGAAALPAKIATADTSVTQSGGITVKKSVDRTTVSALGDLTYTITVTNAGNISQTGIVVTDTLPGGGTATIPAPSESVSANGILDVGEAWTYIVPFTVTQAMLNAGTDLINSVSVVTDTVTTPATATATTKIGQAPVITVDKSVNLATISAPGPLSYTITVVNTGNVDLTGVALVDTLPSGANAAIPTPSESVSTNGVLNVGETWTYTIPFAVTQAQIDAGVDLINTAAVTTALITTAVTDDATTNILRNPAMQVDKQVSLPSIAAPGPLAYTITIANTGNVSLTDVVPADVLDGVTTALPAPTGDGGVAGQLDVGETWTYTLNHSVDQARIDTGGTICNTISVTSSQVPAANARADTTITQGPMLNAAKTAVLVDDGDGLSNVGDTIQYTIRVTNNGNVALTGVTPSDPGPTFNGQAAGASLSAFTPANADLAPNATQDFVASYALTQGDIDNAAGVADGVANSATASSIFAGSTIVSPPGGALLTLPAGRNPQLAMSKAGVLVDDGNGLANPGDTIDYTVTVDNPGNVTILGVAVSDPGPSFNGQPAGGALSAFSPATADIAPGASQAFTATYTLTQADIDNAGGTINGVINTATVAGTYLGAPISAGPSSTSVSLLVGVSPQLTLAKTAVLIDDGDGYSNVADRIEYRISVANSGNVPITGVTPSDPGPLFNGTAGSGALSPFAPGSADIAVGATVDFVATYQLTQADIDRAAGLTGGVTNTASAAGTYLGSVLTAAPGVATLSLPGQQPGIVSITKEALVNQLRRGETAPFRITVTNNSTGSIGAVTVTDQAPAGFLFLEGSARIDGVPVTPTIAGRTITIPGLSLGPNASVVIELSLRALSTVAPGRHTNIAGVTRAGGTSLAPDAEASVLILAEAVFDCSEIIGKVFDDRNRNGYQDEGEPGMPGVRLATVRGTLITTDQYGRYSVPCADLPNAEIGSNYVLKLDVRSLPTGYRLTTENPASTRLSAGKMTELNFGVSIGREVRLDLDGTAFTGGDINPVEGLTAALATLIDVLAQEESTLILTYSGNDIELGRLRVERLEELIQQGWRAGGSPYRLDIETTIGGIEP